MSKNHAIRLENVGKTYKLHGSQRDQLIDVLGLRRIGVKPRIKPKEFVALDQINLEVLRGQRIGIVGRNGAGKTTLLKLLCGNFAPTNGNVEVNGDVQALMNVGLGFHPEYTGRENVEASLQYNGIDKSEYEAALDSIIDFCELGEFFDQPFKTYSLGMQARLMFASATAIRPDILIVDEVLGAGDAYFVAKSKSRVEGLIGSGCTMLLVSHSMQQVLELCDEAIWLDQGKIRMQGKAFEVVKAYEEHLHGPIKTVSHRIEEPSPFDKDRIGEKVVDLPASEEALRDFVKDGMDNLNLQEPKFLPHTSKPEFPTVETKNATYDFVSSGGVSRWDASKSESLEIIGFTIVNPNGKTNELLALQPVRFQISLKAITAGRYSCRYAVNISNHQGQTVISVKSNEDRFEVLEGAIRRFDLVFNPLQLGPGEYIVGIAVLDYGPIEQINHAGRYDLLSRSFQFSVELPSSWAALHSQFFHSAEWHFHNGAL